MTDNVIIMDLGEESFANKIALMIKSVFIGRTYSLENEILEDGGAKCFNQMENKFRFSVYFGMVRAA